jgi:TIR domain
MLVECESLEGFIMATAAKRRKIFISYRREDAADAAGRIRDWLVQTKRVTREDIFMDVEAILPGADFVNVIEQAIAQCKALIVVISPSWIAQVNAPTSYVRLETEAALRQNIQVIPVLVGGVQMPPAEQLPPGLQKLTRLNAREVRAASFDYDMAFIRRALGFNAATAIPWIAVISAVLLVAVGLGVLTQWPEGNPVQAFMYPPTPTATENGNRDSTDSECIAYEYLYRCSLVL